MKTFFVDLDDTLLKKNWEVFGKAYLGGLAKAFSKFLPFDEALDCINGAYIYMVANNDQRTNKEKFYDKMAELCSIDKQALMSHEPYYYIEHYDDLQDITSAMEDMVKSVRVLQAKSYPIVIASQPVFPAIATHKRLAWLGFKPEEFLKVTSFETEYACKPWPKYYQDLLQEFNLAASDCVMVGNDRKEDMVATAVGMQGILITDEVIESDDPYDCQEMKAKEFLAYVESL